jgi:signal transduction histidine kinase
MNFWPPAPPTGTQRPPPAASRPRAAAGRWPGLGVRLRLAWAHAAGTPPERAPPVLLRSAGLRLAMIYALLFALSALALVVFLWWETAGLLNRQVEAAIHADTQGLSERWNEGGLPALAQTIHDRLVENVDDDAIYLVVNAAGQHVTGNLPFWPPDVSDPEVWYELPVSRAGVTSLARVREVQLADGYRLLVGRDVRVRAQLRALLRDSLFWAVFVVAGLGLAGALAMRGLFRRMVANVSATAAAIASGDLTRRVRLSGRGDEFDRLAEAINEMLDRIARLMDGVRQVSNAIAHDLRTPITRARARLEDAAAHARSDADLRAAIERAQSDLDSIVGVFEALLRIAEIEAGARRSAFAMVDIAPLLADLAELYGAVAEERGLQLTLESSARLPLPVLGDRELIQQAVANMLDNAIKFSPEGGTVRLAAAHRANGVHVFVSDEGPGIPPDERARATQRFFRGETARNTPGSGLGLALVQAVAQLHQGTLLLENNRPGLLAVLTLAAQPPREVAQASSGPHAMDTRAPAT